MKRFTRSGMALVLLFSLLILSITGCNSIFGSTQSGFYTSTESPGSIQYPITLKDQGSNTLTFSQQPQRIVSIVPSATEIAYALGLGKQMVGDTTNDDYPAAAKALPKVGDFKIDAEKVLALKPDLVLASSINGQDTINQLKKLGLNVLVLNANSIKEVYQSISLVAQATNHTYQADMLVAKMEQEKLAIFTAVHAIPDNQRVKVWIEIDPTLYTVGGDTFMNELVTLAGGKNVAVSLKGWPQVSAEQVVKWNPDVIISTYGGVNDILARPGWQTITAIQQKRVYAVDANMTSRPGPRIMDGVKQIAEDLYPEQFGLKKK